MLKSKLGKIEVIKELSEKDTLKFDEADINTFISAKIISINKKNNILSLSFYNKENRKLVYRLFLDKKQRDYITQDFTGTGTMKWKTGTLEHIISYYWDKRSIILNDSSIKSILKYFSVKAKPLATIYAFQQSVLKERLAVKHKKITDRIDKKMKLVPKIPKGFKKWIDEEALYRSRYIYYKYKSSNKSMEGYCTHCNSDILVNKPKHNKQGVCPVCKSPIIYKAIGKSTKIQDTVQVGIIQKIPTGIIVRYFKVSKSYLNHYRSPKLCIHECGRDFYENNDISMYEFAEFKQTGMQRWCEGEGHLNNGMFIRYNYNDIRLYTGNLDKSLKNTKWQYCEIKQYAATKKINIYKYLHYYNKYPFIEYLIKLNLTNLVDDILGRRYSDRYEDFNRIFDFNCKKLHNILQLNKSYIPFLQKLNPNLTELRIIQHAYKNNIKITEELINYVNVSLDGNTDIFDYTRRYKLTINKIMKYITSQSKSEGNENNEYIIFTTWRDYIRNCETINEKLIQKNKDLQYDLTNEFALFPKNLIEMHDETVNLLKDMRVEQYNAAIEAMYENLSKMYSFSWKDFMIIVPKSAQDISHEGQKLKHCVGSYIQDVAAQKTTILFLREKNNLSKPFYTMEVKNGTVIQCRGIKNHSMTPEVENFLNQFKMKKLGYTKSA